jgi:hypothetical protein
LATYWIRIIAGKIRGGIPPLLTAIVYGPGSTHQNFEIANNHAALMVYITRHSWLRCAHLLRALRRASSASRINDERRCFSGSDIFCASARLLEYKALR